MMAQRMQCMGVSLIFAVLLAIPALASGPAWTDLVADTDPTARARGAVLACVAAVSDAPPVVDALTTAGWQRFDEYDGSASFSFDTDYLMFAEDAGFCMFATVTTDTDGMTALLADMGFAPGAPDADGCATFAVHDTTATLTGGGNDPACTSGTEAALRFQPAP